MKTTPSAAFRSRRNLLKLCALAGASPLSAAYARMAADGEPGNVGAGGGMSSSSGILANGWADYPAILARIQAPTFPARDFSIAQYGAVANDGGDATAAIAAAIAACHAGGGGRVLVPAGKFLTGPIVLKSNVNLHLAEGA